MTHNAPISNADVQRLIQHAMPGATVAVRGDGYKYQVTVISDEFAQMSTLQRHKKVYAILATAITEGTLHALTIIAKTATEADPEI